MMTELDEILAGDAEKREDQQDEEKMPDVIAEVVEHKRYLIMILRYSFFPFML